MMKSPVRFAAAPLALLLSLAACENETIDGNVDPNANANASANKAAALPPPPMIQASRTYRCKDNSLLYADFYTNGTAQVRPAKDQPGTMLTAAAGQPPYTAEGYSLSANSDQVSYTAPGKGTQTCKA
ncbi:MAG TPA: hypothetical protein VF619_02565 [Allosphingosinicella sp.]|jgi:hypothetical protein